MEPRHRVCEALPAMKPWKTLATDGTYSLRQREREFMVLKEGKILVTSRSSGLEPTVVRLAFSRLITDAPRVLIGGLGFGHTLRAVLDGGPDLMEVTVCEPSESLVKWNEGPLAETNGHALEDPRVVVEVGDIQSVLSDHRRAFDVALLDLDNGPFEVAVNDDLSLYSIGGLSSVRASMRGGGRLVVASAGTHPGFNKRLTSVGFQASVEALGGGHLAFIGDT